MPHAIHVVVRGGAHTPENNCTRSIRTALFRTGTTQRLDVGCMTKVQPAPFKLLAIAAAQKPLLTTDETLAIPKLNFDSNRELEITASATSSQSDFDFLVGKWKMHNRRLNKRLESCKDWTEFESWDENTKILSGTADMDSNATTELPGKEGGKR